MSLQQWYDSLFVRAYPPAAQFAKGALAGAGLPTSLEGAKQGLEKALGLAFGIPSAYDKLGTGLGETAEAVAHPIETAKAIAGAARANPAGAAGFAAGSMMPLHGPRNIPEIEFLRAGREGAILRNPNEALQFGSKAFGAAERRMAARIARERGRVHAELEGPTGPLPSTGGAPPTAESVGDWLRNLPDRSVIAIAPFNPTVAKEMARRGLKPSISDELHVLHEGPARPPHLRLDEIRTREEMGGEMLKKAKLDVPPGMSMEQIDATFLNQKGEGALNIRPEGPPGTMAAFGGGRWVNTERGWTKLEGKPKAADFDWIFKRYFDQGPPPEYYLSEIPGGLMEEGVRPIRESNIERAVELIEQHGDLSKSQARTIVAKRISDRRKAGTATPQEIVWMQIHRMGGFRKGGFSWH